jgi:hypothetical protein
MENGPVGYDPEQGALWEWLAQAEQANPGALQQMIAAGLFDDRMGVEGQTMQIGKGMWDAPTAQGMHVGGTYVASSPLEHLSNAMSKVMGAKFMGDSQRNQRGLIEQKGGGMEALIRAMAQRQPQAPPPMQGPPQFGPGSAAPPWDPYAAQLPQDEFI